MAPPEYQFAFNYNYPEGSFTIRAAAFFGGVEVAEACFCERKTSSGPKLYPLGVEVLSEHQKRGIATTLYKMTEKLTGLRVMPADEGTLKPAGARFRESYAGKHGNWEEPFRE